MSAENRSAIFTRVLAILTAIEVAVGFDALVVVIARFPFHKHSEDTFWFLGAAGVNLLFLLLLAASVTLLWRVRRGGLILLLLTLFLELLYFTGITIVHLRSIEAATPAVAKGIVASWARTSDPSLAIQFLTFYPVIAPILIALAWRESRTARGAQVFEGAHR